MQLRNKYATTTSKQLKQLKLINNLKGILDAKSPTELIIANRGLVSQIFGPDDVGQFVENVCQSWTQISNINYVVDIQDVGTSCALRLRKMTQASCGLLKKFRAAFLTLTPYSKAN
jgi:hypothetical protein